MIQYMYKKNFPLVIIVFGMLASNTSVGSVPNAFSGIDKSFGTSTEVAEATNLPRRYSQDSILGCNSMIAGFLMDATNCRTQGIKDCKKLPDENSFSRVDLMRYAHGFPDKKMFRSYYAGISEGGSSAHIIANMYYRGMGAANHKCSSLDKTLTNFGDSNQLLTAQQRGWEKLREAYNKYQLKKSDCASCNLDIISSAISDISQDFNISKDNKEVLKAFAQDSYDKFLDKLLIPEECSADLVYLEERDKLDLKLFPKDPLTTSNYEENISTIKNVLNKKIPLAVNNLCLGDDFDITTTQKKAAEIIAQGEKVSSGSRSDNKSGKFACSKAHGVVISGYRKICKNNNPNDCRETLKIENSWGETWQKQNNDGWVDAKSFLDRTAYLGQNLLWLEDKTKN